jgi:hypothetical protein
VDVFLSTDGGNTFPITLLSATPNDGTTQIVLPNITGTTNRIMVKGTNQIFFDVNNANFTITGSGTVDTAAPTTSTLYASGTTISGTNLSWTVAIDNIGITGYNVYQNGVLKTTTIAASLAVAGLNASTAYSFYVVAKDAAGNLSVPSNTIYVNTLNNTSLEYCSSYGTSTAKEYIKNVQIGSINNTSDDNNGYGDYTSLSTNLTIGTSNNVVISPAWTSRSSSTEYYNIWIDFNQDGDFDDSDELVFSKSKTKAKTVNGSLVIPTNALSGSSRMRVSMKNDMLPNPCEIFSNGEVEDYTVSITSGATAKTVNTSEMSPLKGPTTSLDTAKPSLKLYPNPVKEDVIYISDIDSNPNYIIYNIMGTIVAKGVLKIKEINVSQLTRGIYIITLNDGLVTATKRFIKQ